VEEAGRISTAVPLRVDNECAVAEVEMTGADSENIAASDQLDVGVADRRPARAASCEPSRDLG
jgi:hypothetical protein